MSCELNPITAPTEKPSTLTGNGADLSKCVRVTFLHKAHLIDNQDTLPVAYRNMITTSPHTIIYISTHQPLGLWGARAMTRPYP